jgi:hypothetical protein
MKSSGRFMDHFPRCLLQCQQQSTIRGSELGTLKHIQDSSSLQSIISTQELAEVTSKHDIVGLFVYTLPDPKRGTTKLNMNLPHEVRSVVDSERLLSCGFGEPEQLPFPNPYEVSMRNRDHLLTLV